MLKGLASNAGRDPTPPDLSHPSMRSWIDVLTAGNGRVAVFETRIWWSPGSAAKSILGKLEAAGYHTAAQLREGELEKCHRLGRTRAGDEVTGATIGCLPAPSETGRPFAPERRAWPSKSKPNS